MDRAQAYVRSHGRLARDVMTAQVVTVEEHTPLTEIARLLETRRIKRVPVIRDNRIVGIVSRADLPRGLALQPTAAQPASDDRGLRQQLLAAFERAGLRWHPYVNLLVSGGKVHLWGLVESREEAKALRLAAQNVPGVAEVDSHLAIRGTGPG